MLTYKQFIRESAAIAAATARKNDPDNYYYHITKGSNMGGISKRGLSRKPGTRNYSFSKRKAVYLSSTPKSAKEFASDIGVSSVYRHGKFKETPHSLRVLRIPKSNIDPKKLHRDRNMAWGGGGEEKPKEWEYHGDIPAKKIEFSGGEHLKKNSKAWKKQNLAWPE